MTRKCSPCACFYKCKHKNDGYNSVDSLVYASINLRCVRIPSIKLLEEGVEYNASADPFMAKTRKQK